MSGQRQQQNSNPVTGPPEPEIEDGEIYLDADELSRFREDGRSKKTFVSIDGEYFHAYLPAPDAPGKYRWGEYLPEPAMSGNYGPKPVPKVPKAKASSSGAGGSKSKGAASGGKSKGSK